MASNDGKNGPGAGSNLALCRQRINEIVQNRYLSQAVCIATKRKIANIVTKDVPVHISEVAKKLDCHEVNIYRMMSFLAANGIFEEKEGRTFIGNDLSETTREDAPNTCYHIILSYGSYAAWQSVVNMELALDKNNDKTPFERVHGTSFYKYLSMHPDEQRNFDLGILSQTQSWQATVPDVYDFSSYQSVTDLAGGCGALLKHIMLKNQHIKATLFENPEVIKNALPELSTDAAFKQRFNAVSGNFLEAVDVVCDLFMVAMTLHCFEDSRLSVIVNNITAAMQKKQGCRLLVIEADYDKCMIPNNPKGTRQLDMTMMLLMGGLERDFKTWESFMNARGLKCTKKLEIPPMFVAMEWELA